MGTVYRRKDGRWAAAIEVGIDGTGRRRRRTFYGKTKREAIAKLERAKTLRGQGMQSLDDSTNLLTFVKSWLSTTAPLTAKPKTVTQYRSILTQHVLPQIGHLRLLDIAPRHIDEVMRHMQQRGLSVATQRQARRVLSVALSSADRDRLIPFNPVSKTRPPAVLGPQSTRVCEPLSREELLGMLDAADDHPLGLLFRVYALTGMRRGEALALRWKDLQENPGTLMISRQLQEVRLHAGDGSHTVALEFTIPKTVAGHRVVPVTADLLERLQRHRLTTRKHTLERGVPWSEEMLIFSNPQGRPLWPSNVTSSWRRFLKASGLRHIRLHDLRHTTATLALEGEAPLASITQLLGHSSISITKDVYAKRVDALAQVAVTALEAHLQPREEADDRWVGGSPS